MDTSQVATLLLVDPHPAVCEAITATASRTGEMRTVGQFRLLRDAYINIPFIQPNVLITEIPQVHLGGEPWTDHFELIHREYPEVKIVVYSMFSAELYAPEVLRRGGAAYVAKSESTADVLEVVRRVRRGEVYVSAQAGAMLVPKLLQRRADERFQMDEYALEGAERQVYELLLKGCVAEDIGRTLSMTTPDVEAIARRVASRLGFASESALVLFAQGWSTRGTV